MGFVCPEAGSPAFEVVATRVSQCWCRTMETAELEREKVAAETAGFAAVGGVTEKVNSSFLEKEIAAAVAVVTSATAETVNGVVPRDSAGIFVEPVTVEFSAVADCVPGQDQEAAAVPFVVKTVCLAVVWTSD